MGPEKDCEQQQQQQLHYNSGEHIINMDPNGLPPASVLRLNKVEQKQEEMANGISQIVKLLSRANEIADNRKDNMDDMRDHLYEKLDKQNTSLDGIDKNLYNIKNVSDRKNNPTWRDVCCSKGI